MARKKRHTSSSPRPSPREARFHMPFGDLKTLLHAVSRDPSAAATPPSPSASPPHVPLATQAQRERVLFLAEMAGVKRLPLDRHGRVEKPRQSPPRTRGVTDDTEALADLRELVEGHGTFTIQYTDEYMEGVAPGIDRRLAQRLHRGDFSIQAHLDLHGYTVDEAKRAVDHFLTNAYTCGQRCVRLVHGRGHNSKDNRPVLKEQVRHWLSHGRLSRLILAFATAPSPDGGAGAVYVLLRRGPQTSRRK